MKKICLSLAAIAAVLSAVSCNKNEGAIADNTPKEDGCVLIAEVEPGAKTVTDSDFKVNWAEGDDLAVYTWPTGAALPEDASVWRAAEPVVFTAAEVSGTSCRFTLASADPENTLAENPYDARLSAFNARYAGGNLDWGVIYPGRMANASRPGMGIVVFGDQERVNCAQIGNDNVSHLAQQDVLYGTASNTLSPVVKMHHVGTMVEYVVKNTGETPFVVKTVKIKVSSASIGGQFRFNVMTGSMVDVMTAINECPLYVIDAEAIPVGGEAKFYQILAPFTLEVGKTAEITVITDQGSYKKTITAESTIGFVAGQQNTIDVEVAFEESGEEEGGEEGEDVTLVQHLIPETWFSSGVSLGCYFNMANGDKYVYGGEFSQADVDIVAFRGSSNTALTFAAPTDQALQDYVDNSIKGWTSINATKVKKVEISSDEVTKLSEIRNAYDAASGDGEERCVLGLDESAVVKTVDGEYALITVTGGTKYGDLWGSFELSLKTVE
ncbi:MAG: hypothetical protein ACI39U_06385 [Candidatus Cryptobacteroides sp.]